MSEPTSRCACEDPWDDCPVHVQCDQECRALLAPVTVLEALAAVEHWRRHGFIGGCSHGR